MQVPYHRKRKEQNCNIRDDIREGSPSVEVLLIQAVSSGNCSIPIKRKRTTQGEGNNWTNNPVRNNNSNEEVDHFTLDF